MEISAKERLIETALKLFHRDGFHATGIDKILAQANVSKMTLYKHFGSKEDLILAVMEVRDQRFRQWLAERTLIAAPNPQQRLLMVFDALAEWFEGDDFYGCLFINASAEYGNPQDKIYQSAIRHKQLVTQWLIDLTREASATNPQALALQLMMIMEGAIVTRQAANDKNAAAIAKDLAKKIVEGMI
jgi:AcrR family transcriptional regulator